MATGSALSGAAAVLVPPGGTGVFDKRGTAIIGGSTGVDAVLAIQSEAVTDKPTVPQVRHWRTTVRMKAAGADVEQLGRDRNARITLRTPSKYGQSMTNGRVFRIGQACVIGRHVNLCAKHSAFPRHASPPKRAH